MNAPKIKFGIMCNKDTTFPRWQADAITALINHEEIECGLLIKNCEGNSRKFKSRLRQLKYRTFLWQIYSYVLGRRSTATENIQLSKELSATPEMECVVKKRGKFSEYFDESDIVRIKSFNLDFILRFEFGIIKGDILDSAKHGVWSFHHGDEQEYRGGPPGFWEIHDQKKITGSILQRLNSKLDAGVVLKKGFLETQLGVIKNRDQMFRETSKWPLQVCLELLENEKFASYQSVSSTKADIKVAPTNMQMIIFIFKINIAKIEKIFRMLMYVDYWNIGVVSNNSEAFLVNKEKPPVHWFPLSSKTQFYADPCGVDSETGCDVFFEEYPYKDGKGVISHTHFSDGVFSKPTVVLREPFHLSYPFIIEHQGDVYMVPESWEANKVLLYKAVEFPKKWELAKVLVDDFAGVDSTLLKHDDMWWMFSTDRNKGSSQNLNLFYAHDLLSEWVPHHSNPIKSDVRSSRSAGKPFFYKDKLYRPSMNYAEKNEGSITLNLVTNFTEKRYSEIVVKEILPYSESDFYDKLHHLFGTKNYTLVDGCKEVFVLRSSSMVRHQINLVISRVRKFLRLWWA
jgi:hypothetical protein